MDCIFWISFGWFIFYVKKNRCFRMISKINKNKKQEIFNSSFLKKSKKGELTTQQIVLLIILIMSFAVILFFLFKLNLGKTTDKEICHNSVMMKGNPALSKTTHLNCKRTYVCITKDGTCEQMTNPDIKKVEEINDIYQVLADEMADCWWMFGEGKIKYVGDKLLERNYCSICTQVAFDDSIDKIEEIEDGKINQDYFYGYLAETEISGNDVNYAEYFFGTNNVEALKNSILNHDNNKEKIITFGEIEIDKQYFITTGIISTIGNVYKWVGAGLGVLVIMSPIGWVGGAILVTSGAATATYGEDVAKIWKPKIVAIIIKGDGVDNYFMAPTIIEADSEKFKAIGCKDILTLA